ncbi:MAG: YceI family protein [Bacteroidetes bacterium]|jgi:polyisoprenoid-binding protein YceI|nr:YceI family protein [Bacteroidota bacterium]
MKTKSILLYLLIFTVGHLFGQNNPGSILSFAGEVDFHSDAPQEQIRASSDQVVGVIDTLRNTFAFQVPVQSFLGFNSELQRQHFNENYMESNRYPKLTYTGKILAPINYNKPGLYKVKTKGIFIIHGVEKEEIIENTIEVKQNGLVINADFYIRLSDYDIRIPRIVQRKIAPEIKIHLRALNTPKT